MRFVPCAAAWASLLALSLCLRATVHAPRDFCVTRLTRIRLCGTHTWPRGIAGKMSGVTGTSSGQWLGPSDSVGTTGSFGAMCDIVGLNSLASANSLGGASIGVDVDRDVSMGLTPSDGALPSPGTDVDPDFLSFLDLDLDNLLFFRSI